MAAQAKLVIVESPAKAKTISRFLGRGYKVEASQGHIRDLPKSQLGVDCEHQFEMKYITIHGRGKILAKIRKEAKSASKVFLATDPDREGEAISWHLALALGVDPASKCRVEFNEVTKKAVLAAIQNPRSIDMDRVDAQQARRALDRLVGYKISPLLWAKVKKGLSAGRVQSVATRMVVDREQEIEDFIPEEYWEITAKAFSEADRDRKAPFDVRLYSLRGGKAEIHSTSEAEDAQRTVEKGHFTVSQIRHSEKKKMPTPPFTTSSLQQEAGRKLNFTTQKTMQVVQALYEGIELGKEGSQGLVTYIRTDSVRISEDAVLSVREFIRNKYGEAFLPAEPNVFKGRSDAQDAHEAIRPTDIERTPDAVKPFLSRDQFLLYKLIYNRFLACQMPPAVYETQSVDISDGETVLRFSGEKKQFAGFTSVYEEGLDEAEKSVAHGFPRLEEGEKVFLDEIHAEQHFTQPPARYTEASLVKAMEEKGIGRPSTYAPTITTIISRGYVTREKKRLYPTEMGRTVNHLMMGYFSPIVDTQFTADLEEQLDAVALGKEDWHDVLSGFYPEFKNELEQAEKEIEKIEIKDEPSDVLCDKCGARMVYRMGRFGKFLACPNFPECKNTKAILNYIGVKCPKCGGEILEKISRKNRKFYGCERYPECDFVSWERPVGENCPVCGAYMTMKTNRKGETWHLCSNEQCRYKKEIVLPEEVPGENA